MLLVVRLFLLRWLAARTLGGVVSGLLALALPAAAVLKVIGLPVLAVAGLVGAPVAALLAVIGLPLAIVLGVVGVIVALAAGAALLGLFLLKYVLPVALVVWAVSRLVRTIRRRTREADARHAAPSTVDPLHPPMAGPVSDGPVSEAPIV
jgi:hypothetical protein